MQALVRNNLNSKLTLISVTLVLSALDGSPAAFGFAVSFNLLNF